MKSLLKKSLCIFLALMLLAASPWIPRAAAYRTTVLLITSSQVMEIDECNPDQINYYTDENKTTKTGSIQVKQPDSPDYLTPIATGDGAVYDMGTDASCEVTVELTPNSEADFIAPDQYTLGENEMPLSGTWFALTLTGAINNTLSFDFKKNNGGTPPGPIPGGGGNMPGPMMEYPILAQFDVAGRAPIEVSTNEDGHIVIPEGWTSGKVIFKALIFKKTDGTVEPFAGQVSGGSADVVDLEIEGIANGEELNATVTGSTDRKSVTLREGFSQYGRLQLHLINEPEAGAVVNQLLNVVHRDLIAIKAEAPFSLSQSFGTVALNQAIITKDEAKDVKIFFGNTEATLIAIGPAVKKITAVTGGVQSALNNDGSATVTLPELSTATTAAVEITIEKTDGSFVKRTVNIVRTAIQLGRFDDGGKPSVCAGYVINKGYLYNNQPHSDAVFNAYLQVILYKDNAVAGYRQIKIDDAELVNSLQDDESGSLELYGERQIAIYGEAAGNFIDGVNKVCVFLTNGPIDFNSERLPSVEFGIGSGVTLQFGGATND